MKELHKTNRQQHEKHLQSRVDSTRAIERLEGSSGGIGERYKFLQEMRGYVQDLLECFSEKVRMQKYYKCTENIFLAYRRVQGEYPGSFHPIF